MSLGKCYLDMLNLLPSETEIEKAKYVCRVKVLG